MRRTPLLLSTIAIAALALPQAISANASPHLSERHVAIATPRSDKSVAHAKRGHKKRYHLSVTRTKGGIPHILAKNFGDAGYGYGYAFARDNICTMADDYVTVEGHRSRYFPPTDSYVQRGNGVSVTNEDSDLFWTMIRKSGIVPHLANRKPPVGPGKQLRSGVRGYVAGYNAYLRHVDGPDGITDPACKGQPWVHPITVNDAYLRF